jgi:hypothetical protein
MPTTETMKYFAWLDDTRIDDTIRDIETSLLGLHETVVSQKSEMLREVCFRHTSDTEELLDRRFAPLQDIEDLETLRIGQNLVNMSIFLICLLWKW